MADGIPTRENDRVLARIGHDNSLKSFNVVVDTPELEAWMENNIGFIAARFSEIAFLQKLVHEHPSEVAALKRRIAELEAQLNEKENS